MVRYRRDVTPGATYFFTLTLRDRSADMLTRHIDLLRRAFASTRQRSPFSTKAMVVLPENLHTVWTLPPDDSDYAGRWRAIKSRFVQALGKSGHAIRRNPKGEADVWQRRFWEHHIRDENDLGRHVDYIHFNPVKHGYVTRAVDWQHSTFHEYVRRGWLSADWAQGLEVDGNHGE